MRLDFSRCRDPNDVWQVLRNHEAELNAIREFMNCVRAGEKPDESRAAPVPIKKPRARNRRRRGDS